MRKLFERNSRLELVLAVVALVLFILSARAIINMASPSENAVKIRNSMIAQVATANQLEWLPTAPPTGFRVETAAVPLFFKDVVAQIYSQHQPKSNMEKALLIGQHLKQAVVKGDGILSNTKETYQLIVTEGRGYCADFTQVFDALAYTSNIPVREWGMAFDGFGAGHAFSEFYDDVFNKWVMIDTFYSFYVVDKESRVPLSVKELFTRLRAKSYDQIVVIPIVQEKFGFRDQEMALNYYKKGADQLFLWGANDVLTYDNYPLVELLGGVSRSLEQLYAIAMGVHPKIFIEETPANQGLVKDILFLKYRFALFSLLMLVTGVTLIFLLVRFLKMNIRTIGGRHV